MTRTTTDLAEWLSSQGLGQYAQTFLENHIEYAVLPNLTEDDLKKLGMSLGHRKMLLRAIQALAAARQVSSPTGAATEIDPSGNQVSKKLLDNTGGPPPGNGTLFGLVFDPSRGVFFVDDGSNTLNLLH